MARLEVGRCLLADILDKRRMTQQDLADKTGLNKQEISDYIHKRKCMSLRTARTIAKALNCYMDDLYEWISTK